MGYIRHKTRSIFVQECKNNDYFTLSRTFHICSRFSIIRYSLSFISFKSLLKSCMSATAASILSLARVTLSTTSAGSILRRRVRARAVTEVGRPMADVLVADGPAAGELAPDAPGVVDMSEPISRMERVGEGCADTPMSRVCLGADVFCEWE
jgi:hypothetical protein